MTDAQPALDADKEARVKASEEADKEAVAQQAEKEEFIKTTSKLSEAPHEFPLPDGRKVKITKIKVKDLGRYMQLVSSAFEELGISSFTDDSASQRLNTMFSSPVVMLEALGRLTPTLMGALSDLTSMSEEEFGELEVEDAFELGNAIWEVNKSFLSQIARTLKTTSITDVNSG